MKLNTLSLDDKKLFTGYLNLARHELSCFSFENIYIWKGLFGIYWVLINDNLCVFFKDKIGIFMYVPALGRVIEQDSVMQAFKIMDSYNNNRQISRIENVEEKEVSFYKGLGLECAPKYPEYLCRRADLARLSGKKYKSKRACLNYFTKHYKFQYMPFSLGDTGECLELFDNWKKERAVNNHEPVYQGMLDDSLSSLKELLENYPGLNIAGRIVKIDGRIKAFTFGFKLNSETFCILYEVTDLSIKGLAQFIFCKFSQELKDYRYINIMDDSGLENLKKVKLSYQPVRLVPAYIVKRKNG